ncbi:uncharacterized protein [Miscanthus floridulus]|uniref:uncharacterized protein n=1 Tax=Miscanthus floridulus TaxID=154761 RepID=UPI00345971CD
MAWQTRRGELTHRSSGQTAWRTGRRGLPKQQSQWRNEVTSDQELMVMFSKHKEKVIEMLIVIHLNLTSLSLNGKEKTSIPLTEDKAQSGSEQEVTENEMTEDEMQKDPNHGPHVEYDKEDPSMTVGSMYPNMTEFKLALSQHAIKNEFEYNTERSGPKQLRPYCSRKEADNCPWRIHASTTADRITVMVKKNPSAHCCSSSRRKKRVRNATRHWICEKVKDWLIQDATLGASALQEKLKEHYKVTIHYKRVFDGKNLALKHLYGDWDSSFDNLYRFKAQVESCCPEGFLSGCRPYLAVDSTFLTGKFKGQLASASAVDGHNWLYPVALGVFDSETNDNWIWFMTQLREAIGSPRGLAICTDARQAVMVGVAEVFPQAEHRECMFHLVSNFKKKFHGKVFDDHLWAAAYSWNSYLFEKHWAAMKVARPAATDYLRQCHKKLWTRSQFLTICKVDYVTNNLAESFNNWIKPHKSMNLDDLMDKIRQMVMTKWHQRRKIGQKLDGLILPHIIKELNEKSRELNLEVLECGPHVAEITALGGSAFRFVVNLEDRTCSCREWQVSGLPCKHALAFITTLANGKIEMHVDSYYSIEKFRAAYAQLIPAMIDKTQWPKSSHGFLCIPHY